ncbi:MAG: TRAP transporter large permease [Alphaproteobacteria bacterium]
MSDIEIGIIGFIALFVLLAIRMPVATAMMIVGFVGHLVLNQRGALPSLAGETFHIPHVLSLTILPLFILMGNLAGISGMSRDLYDAAYAWVGHWRGGLASSTIVGCAGFSALSGSSLASAVTMGRVALPEMQRYKYNDKLATGAIAAGGTLGILIPPSAGFVVYSILTEESIGRLFMAGVLPGILLAGLFVLVIVAMTTVRPELGPAGGAGMPLRERVRALGRASSIIGIILVTIGGIYTGVFSPTEAAGIGALLSFLVAVIRGAITWESFGQVLLQTLRATATTFLILIGAFVFTPFVALSGIPNALLDVLTQVDADRFVILAIVLLFFILLGTFLEGFAILVLSLPLVQPVMEQLNFNMVWFGVLMVIVLEMGLISPPVGVNVFVVKSIAENVRMNDIFKGIFPFWLAMGVALVILILFPDIAMFLPNTMFG